MALARSVLFAGLLCVVSASLEYSTTITTSEPTATAVPNVREWGQCGGQGFTGGTICPIDWICTRANDFFSQCLAGPNFVWPSTTSTAPTTTVTYPPQQTFNYVFSFGDNFTDTGFDLSGAKPAVGNQLGNPPFPGLTTSGGPNWVSNILIDNPNLVAYNFATRGATIDASLVAPEDSTAKSLVDQISEFTSNLVPAPEYAPWNTNNTFFVIWMGNTDITLAYNQPNWPTLCQQLLDKYFEQAEILYSIGARSFQFLEIPQLESTPAMLLEPVKNQQAIAAAIDQFNNLLIARTNTFVSDKGFSNFPSPAGFAQVIGPPIALWFLLNNPTAYGAPNASCYDPDGVSCIWADEYNPGEVFQQLVSVYVSEVVGIPNYQ